MTDDLHRSHPRATDTSIENPAHTGPVTCNFTMRTAHWPPFCSTASNRCDSMPLNHRLKAQSPTLAQLVHVFGDPLRSGLRT